MHIVDTALVTPGHTDSAMTRRGSGLTVHTLYASISIVVLHGDVNLNNTLIVLNTLNTSTL